MGRVLGCVAHALTPQSPTAWITPTAAGDKPEDKNPGLAGSVRGRWHNGTINNNTTTKENRMANANVLDGLACPNCKSDGPFRISITIYADVMMTDDGYGPEDVRASETEWDDTSSCKCATCGLSGYVADFRTEKS